jgi:hypothetical protein
MHLRVSAEQANLAGSSTFQKAEPRQADTPP